MHPDGIMPQLGFPVFLEEPTMLAMLYQIHALTRCERSRTKQAHSVCTSVPLVACT
jgi:hypothetical protein